MAEGHTTTNQPISLEIVEDPHTGLTHYLVIDNEEVDPNGDPTIFEVSATEFFELSQNTINLDLDT